MIMRLHTPENNILQRKIIQQINHVMFWEVYLLVCIIFHKEVHLLQPICIEHSLYFLNNILSICNTGTCTDENNLRKLFHDKKNPDQYHLSMIMIRFAKITWNKCFIVELQLYFGIKFGFSSSVILGKESKYIIKFAYKICVCLTEVFETCIIPCNMLIFVL